jgi:uncharacterized protein (DUF885 family)
MKSTSPLLLIIVLFFTACTKPADTTPKTNAEFATLVDAYYEDGLKLYPISATYRGDHRYNDQFPNFLSEEFQSQEKQYYTDYLNKVNEFNDGALNESERISKEILQWDCTVALEGMEFREDLLPINQMFTINLNFGQLASGAGAQPFKTVDDYNTWLKRVDAYLVWFATAKAKMQEGITLGYVLPKSLIVKVIPQMEAMTTTDIEEHLYYSPIKNIPETFTEDEKQTLADAYTDMIKNKLIPAHVEMTEFLKNDYLAAGSTSSGIQGIPNGDAYYQYRIKLYTTTTMTAEEIHELGLSEVARILSEMEAVKQQVGFEGDLNAFFNFVRTNKELMPYSDPQQVIDHFNVIYETMKPQVEKLFDKKPKALFEVRRTETFREKSASAQYNRPALDGSRPGIFYVPIPNVAEYNNFSDESLFLHEAIPGHHYQVSLAQENTELPQFRKVLGYSGYGEGWALYTESLGKELGLYKDPYQYFGMLSAEMHRAIRLVVDTGLHNKGWTREQAVQYSLDNEALSEDRIISEIERYMAGPGQALSYKIGQLKIRELRTRAEQKLGDKFLIGQFHNQILDSGSLPLSILEKKVDNWIAGF